LYEYYILFLVCPTTGDPSFHKKTGKDAVILEGSVEETIIADWLEAYIGYRNTTIIKITHMLEKGLGIEKCSYEHQ